MLLVHLCITTAKICLMVSVGCQTEAAILYVRSIWTCKQHNANYGPAEQVKRADIHGLACVLYDMYQCCSLKKKDGLACMRCDMCQCCCLRKTRKNERNVLLSYHTASQPPDSWKLRATSVPISASDHVMMVSSAHARATLN